MRLRARLLVQQNSAWPRLRWQLPGRYFGLHHKSVSPDWKRARAEGYPRRYLRALALRLESSVKPQPRSFRAR
jgi:hypothetical protein